MNQIIVITGPTGSGKSTVSLALAKRIDRCVYIEVDHIKHMIISGFHKSDKGDGKVAWVYSEWKLVGETIGKISSNFLDHNFSVVIGGYMHAEGWEELEKHVKITLKVALSPSRETIKIRDSERDEKYFMGEEAIEEHLDYLSNPKFSSFRKLDSSDQSVDEIVDEIIGMLEE